jgi:putative ABC transport system permease protein
MASSLTRKSWTDLSRRPARAILTVLTLALAVASFGILALPVLMNRAVNAEVAASRLYDLSIPVDHVALSPTQLQQLASLGNVTTVTARTSFATRAMVDGRREDAELWGVPDFNNQPLDQVSTTSRPGPVQVLVDVQDAQRGIWQAKNGDRVQLQAADGSVQTLVVAGSGRSLAFNQDTATDHLVLYAAQSTVQRIGDFKGVNQLEFRLQDARRPAAEATVAEVRSFLASQPSPTRFSNLPAIRTPGDWPLKSVFTQRSEVLVILTLLAVLSAAFLLANTVRTMIVEQTGEIGVMRAIGARRRDIQHSYLRTALLLGLFGILLGVPLGIGLAYLLVSVFARLIFGVSPGFGIDWPIVVAGALIALAGVVLVTRLTLRRALRIPVVDALQSEGLVSAFGASQIDRVVLHTRVLPPAVRVGVRNIARHKDRSATTIVQIALAVATLLGLLSLGLAVTRTTDQSWNVLNYDITLATQTGGRPYSPATVNGVRAQPGVSGVEAAYLSQMGYQGDTLYAWGLHANTFVDEPLTAGRWLSSRDESDHAPVIVVGSALARKRHLHPGSTVTFNAAGGPAAFTVIGVGGSNANNGFNVYTTVGALQADTGHPGVVNTLLIRATDKRHPAINQLASRLEDTLTHSGYTSRSQIMYAGRANDQASARTMLVIVELIGLLIVAISMLGLVNTITMNILGRTREIGVLRCLGAPARDLRRVFRTETVTLALAGYILAIPLGWMVAHALQWLILHLANGRLPAPYTLGNLGLALAGTLVLAVLVVVVPLRRAARLRPGDAIRYK